MTTKRRARLKCSCDALGQGICPDCRNIVSRRLNAARRSRGSVEQVDAIIQRLESSVAVAVQPDVRRSDISSRLRCAATLMDDGECSLEAVLGLVASTAQRLDRFYEDELNHARDRSADDVGKDS